MKKYLSIFLICFLLFGASVPAFASTTADIVPPNLDSSQYDSYIISTRSFTNGSTQYNCYLFHSSDWYPYTPEGKEYVQLLALKESPKVIYETSVLSSSYDSSTSNNGWGTFQQVMGTDWEYDDGGIYHCTTVQGNLVLSNQDVPYANFNKDTKTLNYTGKFFFTLTPPLVLATGEALTQFQNQTSQTIMTIALCGVGCLALLIGLSLLRKVLPQFLSK